MSRGYSVIDRHHHIGKQKYTSFIDFTIITNLVIKAQFGLRCVAGMHNTGCKVFGYKKFVKCDKMINNYFFDLIFYRI